MILLMGSGFLAGVAPAAAGSKFAQTNLVSDIPGLAQITDPSLVNAWGISESSGSPFWISDNGAGLSTLYSVPGSGPPSVTKVGLTVAIPGSAIGGSSAAPTGQVFNGTSGFGGAHFIFASEDGVISAWSSGPSAVIGRDNGNADSSLNAVYKGLAISDVNNTPTIYATNFRAGTIDAFDSSFNPTLSGEFVDPNLPAGFAPFNDQVIGGDLYVTYAKQDDTQHDDVPGLGNGFVNVFDLNGNLIKRLITGGPLDSPWGLALAPAGFGSFGGDLLVGNFGDGMINAFDPDTGAFLGALDGTDGNPLVIHGLWGLAFGNGGSGGNLNTLYFTAGPNDEADGLFGALTIVPEPSTWAMMLLGFAGVSLAGYRSRSMRSASAITV